MSDGPTRPITLRDLAEIDVGRLNRVGEKRRAALGAVGIETVLDLLTTYPRRWIDRTNEASIASLAIGEEALVIAEVRYAAGDAVDQGDVIVSFEEKA